MISRLEQSGGKNLGFQVSGDVVKADYDVLVPATQAVVDEFGSVNLLLDLTGFHTEKLEAWKSDLEFGRDYRKSIEKLAVIGDGHLVKLLADVAQPFYAREAASFDNQTDAWAWLSS